MRIAPRALAVSAIIIATVASARASAPGASPRASELPSHVDVRADRVAFFPYQNETLLAGEGHVIVQAGPRTIAGDVLRYDVVHGKLLVTGEVRVTSGGRDVRGQAYALELSSGNAEMLRIDEVPATFALHDDDPATAVEGPVPKDTFAQPDLDGARPYIRSRHAIVTPGAGVRMSPADFPTGAGPSVRLPTFFYTIVANQNITQTSLPGATFDQPFNLSGSPGSLLAAHLRYDSFYGPTLALDERLVNNNKSYAVFSLIPLFRGRRIDALAFEAIQHGLQQTISATHTIGPNPYNAASYRLQNTGRSSVQTFQTDLSNYNNDIGVSVATIAPEIPHLGAGYQLNAGYAYDHNFFGFPVTNDFRTTIGGYVYAPTLRFRGTTFDEQYNYSYTSYDYPHQVNDGTFALRIGRQYRRVAFLGSANFEQVDDRFRDPAITKLVLGLPDPSSPYYAPDGTFYPGFFAFAGRSTYRTYQLVTTYSGQNDNRVVVTLAHTHDFPQYHGYGRPPLTLTLDVARRITPLLRIELARSYTFGWDGRYLSPAYSVSISP